MRLLPTIILGLRLDRPRRPDLDHLTKRLGEDQLLNAAGSCGIQNSPPGSALLALHARMLSLTRHGWTKQLSTTSACCRAGLCAAHRSTSPQPTHRCAPGVLPPTEKAMRHFILGVPTVVDKLGLSLMEAVS